MKEKIIRLSHEKKIEECENAIFEVKKQNKNTSLLNNSEIKKLEKKLNNLKKKVYSSLKSWDRIAISRHPQRPHTIDYIKNLCDEFVEIYGDRTFGDDQALITGFAKIDGQKFIVIGLEKGNDTESRLYRNFGMAHPEGYRKALRAMKLAERFHLPVLSFIDTPGAFPGLTAEERGQGWMIANNLLEMARLKTPIIVVLIGEGCSGGALGIGVGDVVAMLEHSYYSVISPEGCASILWNDAKKNNQAATTLKLHPEHLIKQKVIDHVIAEPPGGAHLDPQFVYKRVKDFILIQSRRLKIIPIPDLMDNRYKKFRTIGAFKG